MGLYAFLFGRNKLKKPKREQFFSIVGAASTVEERENLSFSHRAGVVFSPVDSLFFEELDREIRDLLKISSLSTNTKYQILDDSFGARWVSFEDKDFEDLVEFAHIVNETFIDHGYGDRLIASVFGFIFQTKKAYWIYYSKRGKFYPLVFDNKGKRDHQLEFRLANIMEAENIEVEKADRWYPLTGIPF
tara:strand:- start:699 stop:1265 length:567 start_codon:yes stop_codon:yes gene_type:complete